MSTDVASLEAIATDIRAVQARDGQAAAVLREAAQRRADARKYHTVEIGWHLLRAREIHLKSAGQDRSETVSGRQGQDRPAIVAGRQGQDAQGRFQEAAGFYAWLAAEHPDIPERTARKYMNAARNAGLSAESTAAEVLALRESDALAGKTLSKLYVAPGGDEDPAPSLADQMQAKRLMAELKWTHGRSGLLHQIHEFTIENPVFAELPPEVIERIYFKLTEAAEKVGEYRPNKGQPRRAA